MTWFGLKNDDGTNIYSNAQTSIQLFYFAATTLTTVGFGDFYLVSEYERMIAPGFLLIGVIFFSFAMSIFIDTLNKYHVLIQDLGDKEDLTRFLNLIKRFNGGVPLENDFNTRVEDYF